MNQKIFNPIPFSYVYVKKTIILTFLIMVFILAAAMVTFYLVGKFEIVSSSIVSIFTLVMAAFLIPKMQKMNWNRSQVILDDHQIVIANGQFCIKTPLTNIQKITKNRSGFLLIQSCEKHENMLIGPYFQEMDELERKLSKYVQIDQENSHHSAKGRPLFFVLMLLPFVGIMLTALASESVKWAVPCAIICIGFFLWMIPSLSKTGRPRYIKWLLYWFIFILAYKIFYLLSLP